MLVSLRLFNVVFIGLGKDEPIDFVRIITGRVFAMPLKLDRESVKRTGVHPLQKTFHDKLCPQIETRDLPNNFGFQIAFDGRHRDKPFEKSMSQQKL